MTRAVVHLPPINPETFDTSGIGVAGARAEFTAVRDALRTGLAAAGVVVSDIGIWSAPATFVGMIFECHDSTNNSSLYIISGYSTSTVAPDIDEYLAGTGTNLRTIVKQIQFVFASASVSPGAGMVIGCNPDTSISRADLDFDDPINLTYSGGDFTSLTTVNPDSLAGLQAIFPSHCTYAMDTSIAGTYPLPHAIAYDSAEAAWLYATQWLNNYSESYVMWGPVLEPSADANEFGTVYIYGSLTPTSGYRGAPHATAEVSAFDPSGTRQDYDISVSTTLDANNYKVSGGADDGKFNWRRVDVINGTGGAGIKGTVKPHLMCEVGIYRDGTFYRRPINFSANSPVVCYTESCAFFWAEGARLFPSYAVYNP